MQLAARLRPLQLEDYIVVSSCYCNKIVDAVGCWNLCMCNMCVIMSWALADECLCTFF